MIGDEIWYSLWGVALDGMRDHPTVSASRWAEIRGQVWALWAEEIAAGRRGAYPPHDARHDGLIGRWARQVFQPGQESEVQVRVEEGRCELAALSPEARAAIPADYFTRLRVAAAYVGGSATHADYIAAVIADR